MNTVVRSPNDVIPTEHSDMTVLFSSYVAGDRAAADRLFPLVYEELRRVAQHHIRRERSDHTLQGTALVNEAFIRLQELTVVPWNDRLHFFRLASQIMRHVLVDHARAKLAQKRGGDLAFTSLDQTVVDLHGRCSAQLFSGDQPIDEALDVEAEMIALDEALARLRALSERQAQVIDLRFFGGLSLEDTAQTLSVSLATVKRDWTMARLYLKRELELARRARA